MARIRSVKPELRTSITVAEWPREVRYAWVLLWGYLDDHGRGVDDLRLIAADLFPLDRDVTERKMDRWLNLMAASASICRYEVAGRRYVHAINWTHQRVSHPKPSRIPLCPHHEWTGEPPDDFENDPGEPSERSPNGSGNLPENLGNGSRSRMRARPAPAAQGAGKGAGSREGERASAPPEISTGPNPTRARCPQHTHLPPDDPGPNCQRCATERHNLEAVQALFARDAAEQTARRNAADRAAIAACNRCDLAGWINPDDAPAIRCNHQPAQATA